VMAGKLEELQGDGCNGFLVEGPKGVPSRLRIV